MIQRGSPPPKTLAFLISVEMVGSQITSEDIMARVQDSISCAEGTGKVEMECLGEISEYETEAE